MRYRHKTSTSKNDNTNLIGEPNAPENVFNVSMILWVSFDGFNLNLQKGYDYLLPIFTFGKFYKENDTYWLSLSVQIHHAGCDGFHVCRLINELQEILNIVMFSYICWRQR